jgi:hypothetical protein
MLCAMFYCYAEWCYDAIMNVIVLCEVFFVVMHCGIMLNGFMLNVAYAKRHIFYFVICDIMLNGVILNAIMLGVVFCVYSVCRYAECRIFIVVLMALSTVSFILTNRYAVYCYAECQFYYCAERRNAECTNAECRGAPDSISLGIQLKLKGKAQYGRPPC